MSVQADATRLKELLEQAIEHAPARRREFLESVQAEDDALGRQLRALISAWEQAATALREPTAAPLVSGRVEDFAAPGEGDTIGPYVLGPRLGAGGFGVVHRATQERPVRRELALKLIRPGMDSASVLARFHAERQALARLTHPAIARIFDAGTTPGGRPFFAMELVDGEPITEFCDRARMDLEGRLQLFAQVCHAVQHAHQKGIIHRDLKPTNVLITIVDGQPLPKIIDFGIAKAIDEPLTDLSMITLAQQLLGTPRYMSPEQASLDSASVDTRSDVYSLGVMLYELLSGTAPLTDDALNTAGLSGLHAVLARGEFPRPSRRVAETPAAQRERCAAERGVTVERLARRLAGDLDVIALHAIEADPARRYGTALALARDVERYLAGQPIEARPPSRAYLLRRFVGRHRVMVAAVVLATAGLLSALGAALWGLRVAGAERDAANEALAEANVVTDFLSRTIASVDASQRGRDVRVADLLDEAAAELAAPAAADEPMRALTQARLHHVLGNAYWALGDWDSAAGELRRAIDLRAPEVDPGDTLLLTTRGNLASVLYEQGDLEAALAISASVVERAEATLAEDDEQLLGLLGNHALMLKSAGHGEDVLALEQRLVALNERVFGPRHGRTIGSMHNLANTLLSLGRADEAAALYRDALRRGEEGLGVEAPETVLAREALARFHYYREEFDRAEPLYAVVLEQRRRLLGEGHPGTLLAAYNLGASCLQLGQRDRATELFGEIIAASPDRLPVSHQVVQAAVTNLVLLHGDTRWEGVPAELVRHLVEICRAASEAALSRSQRNVVAGVLAEIRPESLRDPDLAVRLAEGVCAEAEMEDDPFLFGYLDTLGGAQAAAGDVAAARETFRRALSLVPEDDEESRAAIERRREELPD